MSLFLICLGSLVGLVLSRFADDAGLPTAAPPATPRPDPPTPVVPTIDVDGEKITADQAKRWKQQASQVNKVVADPRYQAVQSMDPGDLSRAVKLVQEMKAAPTSDAQAQVEAMDEDELRRMIRKEFEVNYTYKEADKAMKTEEYLVTRELGKYNLSGTDLSNGVLLTLNKGISDGKGGIIPGSAARDDQNRAIPATPEQIENATKFYLNDLATKVEPILKKQIGSPPDHPPMTGAGLPVGSVTSSESPLRMSRDERLSAAQAFLDKSKAPSGTASGTIL